MSTTTDYCNMDEAGIVSKSNLTLCRADYFEACWCKLNSSEPISCPYLLRHDISSSNSSHFCVYHTIRKAIECFNSSYIFPQRSSVSNVYIYLTITLFIIGLLGNGISIIILLCSKLRRLSIYRNLIILCFLNIIYLFTILIRHRNMYKQDLRDISTQSCRWHTFTVAFIGRLCSWQLVSTSIQRGYALLSLQSHRTTSWIQTWSILFICIVIPLFIFDSQLLFNYGIFKTQHICNDIISNDIKQFQRALNFPINISTNISLLYHTNETPTEFIKPVKTSICILWNFIDTLIYAMIPFIITLLCSIIIIAKVSQRRRSTVILGGTCHINRNFIAPQDHLSTLLITINILFLLMTAPLNICLLSQSIYKFLFATSSTSTENFRLVNEHFRLLQNSYHALSFIFYCVIGNKFRKTARSICRTIYCKILDLGINDRCAQAPLISCCFDRRRSSSSGQTLSTNSRLSANENIRRLTIDQRVNSSLPLNIIKRPTYVTFENTQKPITKLTTPF